ncbi:MAG: hypothetical protein EOO43_14760 [Flavobacterium sp.]|nr:MAG: hypothetical protein EOO43_14760 [Flavobacterium sp.]
MKVKIFKSFQGSGRSKIGDKPFETLLTLDEGEFTEDGEKYEFISATGQPLSFLKRNIKFENEETLLLSSSWNDTFIHCNLLLEKKKIGHPFIITGYRDIWDGEPFHLIVRVEEYQ